MAHRVGLRAFMFACCALVWASQSPAENKGVSPPTCVQPTALGRVACQLSATVPQLESATVVTRVAQGLPKGADGKGLSRRLSQLVAAELAIADGGAASELSEAILRTRTPHLIWVEPSLRGPQLETTLDVVAVARGFWSRVKQLEPERTHHNFASQRIDPEIRSFIPIPKLVASHVHKARGPSRKVHALACGDLDGDGGLEVALLDRHRVHVGRVQRDKFNAAVRVEWGALSAVSPAPLREPLMGAYIRTGHALEVGSTDRQAWLLLDGSLKERERRSALLPFPGLGCAQRDGLGISPTIVDCQDTSRTVMKLPFEGSLDTAAGFWLQGADGSRAAVGAVRILGETTLRLFDERGASGSVTEAGAQAALGDLDVDGKVEVAVSRDTMKRNEDSLRVFTWDPPSLRQRFEVPVPGGIDAMALCPAEGPLQAPIVVATGAHLWIVQ